MARGRFLLPILGLFVVFSLIWSVGNNRHEEQEAWMQGYMAGQMSVQSADGGTVVNPMPYNMYSQGYRGGGGPGFFGLIPLLILGFIGFKVIRGGMFRRWRQAGGPGYAPWGDHSHSEAEWRGWGRDSWKDRHPSTGNAPGQPERPVQPKPGNQPTDDEVI
jgi:hypothetical protein